MRSYNGFAPPTNSCRLGAVTGRVSSPGESHPEALAQLYVSLSTHTAPITEPRGAFPSANEQTIAELRRTCARLCHAAEASWSKSSFCLGTFRYKPRSDILAASSASKALASLNCPSLRPRSSRRGRQIRITWRDLGGSDLDTSPRPGLRVSNPASSIAAKSYRRGVGSVLVRVVIHRLLICTGDFDTARYRLSNSARGIAFACATFPASLTCRWSPLS